MKKRKLQLIKWLAVLLMAGVASSAKCEELKAVARDGIVRYISRGGIGLLSPVPAGSFAVQLQGLPDITVGGFSLQKSKGGWGILGYSGLAENQERKGAGVISHEGRTFDGESLKDCWLVEGENVKFRVERTATITAEGTLIFTFTPTPISSADDEVVTLGAAINMPRSIYENAALEIRDEKGEALGQFARISEMEPGKRFVKPGAIIISSSDGKWNIRLQNAGELMFSRDKWTPVDILSVSSVNFARNEKAVVITMSYSQKQKKTK